ncbi:MAG: uracil-DNA glycosylase [Gammaproteobacteria bacterium]|nr:uracil-DNA glycosylase [Gammaproteobacteria bacterium]
MNATRLDYLQAMGIEAWQPKHIAISPCAEISHAKSAASPAETISLNALRAAVASCMSCELHKTRTQTVFGVGNEEAKLMIIGEAPGFHEDQRGEPFVGRAGQLLNAMLESIGLDRKSVFIANILKCRPPGNRDPLVAEVNECTPFLQQQIALIKPKLLLAVGRIAAHYLLNTKTSLVQLRGKHHQFGATPLIVTYHPAYLLRNPIDKGKAFQDLLLTQQTLQTLS